MQTVHSMLRLLTLGACATMAMAFATTRAGGAVDVGSETAGTKCPCTADPARNGWIAASNRMSIVTPNMNNMQANVMTDYMHCFAGRFELPKDTGCSQEELDYEAPNMGDCQAEFEEWAQNLCGPPEGMTQPSMIGGFFGNLYSPAAQYREYRVVPFGGNWVGEMSSMCGGAGNVLQASLKLGAQEGLPASYTICDEVGITQSFDSAKSCAEKSSNAACNEIEIANRQNYNTVLPLGDTCETYVSRMVDTGEWKANVARKRCGKLWYVDHKVASCENTYNIGFCGWIGGRGASGTCGMEQNEVSRIIANVDTEACDPLDAVMNP